MKKLVILFCAALLTSICLYGQASAMGKDSTEAALAISLPFEGSILTNGLEGPWEMLWGPDNMLWITERQGKRITRVNPETGEKKVAGTIEDAFVGPQHEGLLGLALSPNMTKSAGQVYVAYTYKTAKGEFERVVRFDYNGSSGLLSNRVTILEGIPAAPDHQGGRLLFGPDGKLYLTKGELGNNQNANYCKPIEAQRLPTATEIGRKNYIGYLGKILRLNPDGGIPHDNPSLNGIISHVYTYGHRNPQGLVFVDGILYSSEQGPSSDDEVNIIVKGGNYGWPHVAGYQDDNAYRYANYSAAGNCSSLKFDPNDIPEGVPVQKESEWETPENFMPPAKTFYTVPPHYNFKDGRCAGSDSPYLCWGTIAPGSIAYYPENGPIPGWGNSLLLTSLKNGALYRCPLSADKKQLQGYTEVLFHSANRYRVVRLHPGGKIIYIATDNTGPVMGADGKPTRNLLTPGAILKIEYKGK